MIYHGSLAYSVLSPLFSKTSELVEVPEEADGSGDGSDLRTRSNSGEWKTSLQGPEHTLGLQGLSPFLSHPSHSLIALLSGEPACRDWSTLSGTTGLSPLLSGPSHSRTALDYDIGKSLCS